MAGHVGTGMNDPRVDANKEATNVLGTYSRAHKSAAVSSKRHNDNAYEPVLSPFTDH